MNQFQSITGHSPSQPLNQVLDETDASTDRSPPMGWVNLATRMQGSSPLLDLPPIQPQSSVCDLSECDHPGHYSASGFEPCSSSPPSRSPPPLPRLAPAVLPRTAKSSATDPVQRAHLLGEILDDSRACDAGISRILIEARCYSSHSVVDDSRPLAEFDLKGLRYERAWLAAACRSLEAELALMDQVRARAEEFHRDSSERLREMSGLIDRLDRLNATWSTISVREAEARLHGTDGRTGLKRKASAET